MQKGLLLALLILISFRAFASEEIPVNIKADKLKYSEKTGQLTATGSVEVDFEGILIKSDSLQMNTNTNVVIAEGNVVMKDKDYSSSGSAITYNVNDETANFSDFQTQVSAPKVKGLIYLRAQTAEDMKKFMRGQEGAATTCDQLPSGHPHYQAMAKKIEYYPGDKIIGWSVTLYEQWIGQVPVFWFPYFIYDLQNRRQKNWLFGHNDVEGDFVKTSWDYPRGLIYLDQMQKKGFGWGISYDYNLLKYGSGTAYLYLINENDTSAHDSVLKLNHAFDLTPQSKINLAYSSSNIYLIPAGRMNQSEFKLNFDHSGHRRLTSSLNLFESRISQTENYAFNLNYSKDKLNTAYSFALDQGKIAPRYIRNSQRFNLSFPLFRDTTMFKTNISYFDSIAKAGDPGDERLDPEIEIVDSQPYYSLRFYENWRIDPDQELFTSDRNDEYIEKQPEVTLSFKPLEYPLVNFNPSLGAGWYREVKYVPNWGKNRDFATSRFNASLTASKSYPQILGTTFSWMLSADQYLYGPGDAFYVYREEARLNTDLLSHITNNFNFQRGISEGNSPFFFDKAGTKYSYYKDIFTLYHEDKVKWSAEGGFNWETNKYMNLLSSLDLKPSTLMRFSFKTGYDIESKKYLDLSTSANFVPWPKLKFDLSLVQDLNLGRLNSANSLLDWEIGTDKHWLNHWQVKLAHIFDPATQSYQLRDIMIAKDLHCWEAKYTYSDYRKEFSLTFTLKAMPGEPIGFNTGRGFYFDGFQNTINQELKSDSPKRY